MNKPLNILFIAMDAPPKNSAEAIQVRRILAELDNMTSGKLVTVAANEASKWARNDATLALPLNNYDTQILSLPFHGLLGRVLMSHRLAWLHKPDNLFWIQSMAGRVLRGLQQKPDAIYSRSSPFSGALLARKLQQHLEVPWVMHLSDPWADNPYGKHHPQNQKQEHDCFAHANLIALTTQGQADFYRQKYPQFAGKIMVSPNVMPEIKEHTPPEQNDGALNIVFAGALYGERSPQPLLNAVEWLRENHPDILTKLRFDFYGNAQPHCMGMLQKAPDVMQYHGAVSFERALDIQQKADMILTIEPEMENPLSKYFLPSKVIDCLAMGKPILAITPQGSETDSICKEGYGWAVAPSDIPAVGECLKSLVEQRTQIRNQTTKPAPERYRAKKVVEDVILRINGLI